MRRHNPAAPAAAIACEDIAALFAEQERAARQLLIIKRQIAEVKQWWMQQHRVHGLSDQAFRRAVHQQMSQGEQA